MAAFEATKAQISSGTDTIWSVKPKIFTFGPLEKKFSDSYNVELSMFITPESNVINDNTSPGSDYIFGGLTMSQAFC